MKSLVNSAVHSSHGERKCINPELWYACAGPLVSLPPAGSLVVYFPQGHSEQVAASMRKDADSHIPNYPNLPSKLICLLHNVTLHADAETDEVYAQMTLQPVNTYDKEALLASDLALKANRPQTEFFCKTLTASDTSTHGGFSVPRRAAEKIFPPLDFTMQPPAQELAARDLHDNVWTFRHIYRGQPKRHLLTSGWSLFVSGKRLFAGDSVLFIRDEKSQLLLGIRRANRQPTNISSSVLSSDSMHIGILAAAAHAAANHSPFTVFYNPRASPSEFVIPLAKYNKAVYSNQISLGMRFRMMFETEDSGTRRYMGTVTGVSDIDPLKWKNSQWRNLQVGWDESSTGERRNRVSIWEIEPVAAPFFICPSPFFRTKRPRLPGITDDEAVDMDDLFKRAMPWLAEDPQTQAQNTILPGFSLAQWLNAQQNSTILNSNIPSDHLQSLSGHILQNLSASDLSNSQNLGLQAQSLQQSNFQFNCPRPPQQLQIDQNPRPPVGLNQSNSTTHLQKNEPNQMIIPNQTQSQHHVQIANQQQNSWSNQVSQIYQQLHLSEYQHQMQLLQKLQQQQQSVLTEPILKSSQQETILDQQWKLSETPQNFRNPSVSSQQQNPIQGGSMFSNLVTHCPQQKLQNETTIFSELAHLLPPSSYLPSVPSVNLISSEGIRSDVSNDGPSYSTSLTNKSSIVTQSFTNKPTCMGDELAKPPVKILTPGALEAISADQQLTNDLQNVDAKPLVVISRTQTEPISMQPYVSNTHMDYLDSSSSSVTSVCVAQGSGSLQQNQTQSFNTPPIMFRDTMQDGEVFHANPTDSVSFGVSNGGQFNMPSDCLLERNISPEKDCFLERHISPEKDCFLERHISPEKDLHQYLSSGDVLTEYGNSKEIQQELSSSVVSQSLRFQDMAMTSIDSAINDDIILERGSWGAAPPQLPRMRTFTKVYKRGAVGRSIDITRYSGYDDLKQDLARRFGIEGQLEDQHKIGWKLVYVDHENDVLLVGDDPWEEFVNCVRCIKILSPQEVQQMSLDGDFGNAMPPPNQICSSSEGVNIWVAD